MSQEEGAKAVPPAELLGWDMVDEGEVLLDDTWEDEAREEA